MKVLVDGFSATGTIKAVAEKEAKIRGVDWILFATSGGSGLLFLSTYRRWDCSMQHHWKRV